MLIRFDYQLNENFLHDLSLHGKIVLNAMANEVAKEIGLAVLGVCETTVERNRIIDPFKYCGEVVVLKKEQLEEIKKMLLSLKTSSDANHILCNRIMSLLIKGDDLPVDDGIDKVVDKLLNQVNKAIGEKNY